MRVLAKKFLLLALLVCCAFSQMGVTPITVAVEAQNIATAQAFLSSTFPIGGGVAANSYAAIKIKIPRSGGS